jgi:hypothetical protein
MQAIWQTLERQHRQWRRARNLRLRLGEPKRSAHPSLKTGALDESDRGTARGSDRATARGSARGNRRASEASSATRWIGIAGVIAALGGAVLIAGHARQLSATAAPAITGAALPVDALRMALPGVAFEVPGEAGITLAASEHGALLIAAGLHAAPPVKIDLCRQLVEPGGTRLAPLRVGYQFDAVARLLAGTGNTPLTLRSIALAGPAERDMPRLDIDGDLRQPLRVRWNGLEADIRYLSDSAGGRIEQGASGVGSLDRQAWLVWRHDAALHLQRRPSAACPQAGELLIQHYQRDPDRAADKALVMAFSVQGAALSSWLAAGRYQVPVTPPAGLEDQALFEALLARGLLRLSDDGLIEVAPRDLAAWQGAANDARAADLTGWDKLVMDDGARQLLRRFYRMADGDYVREQIRVFNTERLLLAWRARPAEISGQWQASLADAPVAIGAGLPASATRLLAAVPQGWSPWRRITDWPQANGPVRLSMTLPHAANGGETISLMVAGRVNQVRGARLSAAPEAICDGRICPSRASVQLLALALTPGAREVSLDLAPISMSTLAVAADQRYRHVQLAGGKLAWQPLETRQPTSRVATAPVDVTLADRNGTPLWSEGAPTASASKAGLATMLGVRADHINSVAGILARLPSSQGSSHSARLTLDLPLQLASAGALDCIGMRRGHWDGARCSGGHEAPSGRQAGLVIIDTENGDILAAAGAGAGTIDAANWDEVRDFDRADPARSPLRLAAFQHDGGAHRSPGSTFKVISALGLELAAKDNPQIDAILAGVSLPALNRVARDKGFAFRTDSASYPADTSRAHITNYRDQFLDRRAQDGRLGLAQALTYSLNTWFAWSSELSDRSLFGRSDGGAPDLQPLDPAALDDVRPIVAMAHRLGFEQALKLDGGLLPADFAWSTWDALQTTAAHIDPIHTRHELRQMAIGLRMQTTPLQMALAAGAIGQGRVVAPRLLLALDEHQAQPGPAPALGVRLDRIRAGMKGVIDTGTAAGAFRGARFDAIRAGLFGKTGTSPTGADGRLATVWFTAYLQAGSLPGQTHRLAIATFVSHSEATGGEHAAPIVAAVLASQFVPGPALQAPLQLALHTAPNPEQKGK